MEIARTSSTLGIVRSRSRSRRDFEFFSIYHNTACQVLYDRHTDRQTNRHTDGHEYSIVAVTFQSKGVPYLSLGTLEKVEMAHAHPLYTCKNKEEFYA